VAELDERVEAWTSRVRAGVRAAVEAELDRFEEQLSDDDREAGLAALRRVRAELASCDHGPISDLLRAATSTDEPQERRRFTLEAARRLALVHGRPLVDELVAEAGDARVQQAFASGTAIDPDPIRAEIVDALGAGQHARAREAADRWTEGGAQTHVLVAALAAEEGDWAEAARCRELAIERFPDADDVLRHRAAAGLAWWAAGDAVAARRQLSTLRDATRESDDGQARHLHAEATTMLEALDAAASDRPAWIRVDAPAGRPLACAGGRGVLGLLAWANPDLATLASAPRPSDPDDHPTAAHVRRTLDLAGIVHARRRFDATSIEAALRGGAWVVLEEERPTDTGFVWIRGWDPVARLLEVVDPARPGRVLRRFDAQRDRSALFAMSGFVVWGRGDVGRRRADAVPCGLEHDPALDRLDACDLDEDGQEPPRARVESLAAAALEAHPGLPMLHRRRGEALLAKLSSGDIEPGPRGAFEGWLAATRERFPDAEWPFQLHARALELQGRTIEACIAWKDAALRDPFDYRNALGQARAFAREGSLWAAYRALRKASALAPGVGEIEGMLALNALHRDDREQLRVHARLARALAPDDARAIMASATAAEHDRDFGGAVRLLEQLAVRDDVGSWAPARLHRRHAEASRWQHARTVAAAACSRFPAEASVWARAAELALADGDPAEAFELACAGIDRCGGADDLVEVALDGALFGAATPAHREAVDVLVGRLLPQPSRVDAVVRRLVAIGDEVFAIDVARRAAAAFGRDLDGPWLLARSLLRTRATRAQHLAEAAAVLEQVITGSGSFPYPRVFIALQALAGGEAERALAVLEPADVPRSPVLVWELTARALDALGRGPAAEALRARLPEGYPAGVTGEVAFLCTYGHARLAADLLEAMIAHRGREPDALLELSRCFAAMGEHARAFELVVEAGARVDAVEQVAAAERVRRWDVVHRAAASLVEELEIDSGDARDVWEWRAVAAGAAAAQGDVALRERLQAGAPRHVRAWRRLVRIERAAALPEHGEHVEHLRAFAPGAAVWIEEGAT
jgi:tetratricopeptide (TPR) repeat protein